MSDLAALQELLSTAVLAPLHAPRQNMPLDRRGLEVYRQAYRLRLLEVLLGDYPVLARLLDGNVFEELGRTYVESHRSGHFSVRWFGREFPRHVLRHARPAARRVMAEIARLEWLIGEAFDAADELPANAEALAAIASDHWPGLVLRLHPTVRLLRVHEATTACWEWARDASAGDSRPCPTMCAGGTRSTVVIWRADTLVRYRVLDEIPALVLKGVRSGVNVAELCEILSRYHRSTEVPRVVATLFAEWIAAGLVAGVHLDG